MKDTTYSVIDLQDYQLGKEMTIDMLTDELVWPNEVEQVPGLFYCIFWIYLFSTNLQCCLISVFKRCLTVDNSYNSLFEPGYLRLSPEGTFQIGGSGAQP